MSAGARGLRALAVERAERSGGPPPPSAGRLPVWRGRALAPAAPVGFAAAALLAVWVAAAPITASAQAPSVEVGVRPVRVRAGSPFVVSVRVTAEVWPDEVSFDPPAGVEVLDVRDGASMAAGPGGRLVFRREFELAASVVGDLALPPVVVGVAGDTVAADVPRVAVSPAPLPWAAPSPPGRAREDYAPLSEGEPPLAHGRTYDATRAYDPRYGYGYPYGALGSGFGGPGGFGGFGGFPGGGFPGGGFPGVGGFGGVWPGVPGSGSGFGGVPGGFPGGGSFPGAGYPVPPYGGPHGPYLPPGEGWAEHADADPLWAELVPELYHYATFAEDPRGLARLEAGLTPDVVYVGQQVTLFASVTLPPEALLHLTHPPALLPSRLPGARAVELPYAPPLPGGAAGRLQEVHTYLRAYFPETSGSLLLEEPSLAYGTADGGFGDPGVTLVAEPLPVTVLPLPVEVAPPGWNGAVGRYGVSAWVEPDALVPGQAAFLTVEVKGAGYVPGLPPPHPPPVWNGGLRPVGERAWLEARDGVAGGVKRFTWLVVPLESGTLHLDPVVYWYFDPWLGDFAESATEEIELYVDEGVHDPRRGPIRPPSGPETSAAAGPIR